MSINQLGDAALNLIDDIYGFWIHYAVNLIYSRFIGSNDVRGDR